MATASQADLPVTQSWVDIVTLNAALANVDVKLQNKSASVEDVYLVYFGGASAPASTTAGDMLRSGDSTNGNAAKIWVREKVGGAGDGVLGATLL